MNRRDLKIIFMGTPEFAGTNLKALIEGGYNVVLCLCQPDKPVGRKHILTAPPVKVTAQENGKDNGCIINTAMQVTDVPKRILVAVNKDNLTHDMVVENRKVNVF